MTSNHPVGVNRRRFLQAAGVAASAGPVAAIAVAPSAAADDQHARTATARARGYLHESEVFAAGDDGLAAFHVFGVALTTAGTVLAFAEGRIEQGDATPHHIVLRRSTDGGRTWGERQYVRRSDGTESFTNPTPVVDRESGRISLFYGQVFRDAGNQTGSPDYSRVFLVTSDDDGITWTPPRDKTELVGADDPNWTLHMPGPGHGIQLADGRILIQIWHRRAIAFPVRERRYGVSVVHSDDGGRTWAAGGVVPVDGEYPINESRLLERPDGSLALFGRYASGGTHPRLLSVSTDRGAQWSPVVLDASARPVNAIDTGIERISGGPGSDDISRSVYTRTDSPLRRNLTVSLSYDDGMSWSFDKVLTAGPASYSDAVALADDRIGVLYGRNTDGVVPPGFSPKVVAFAAFDLTWLTDGSDRGGSGPVVCSVPMAGLEVTANDASLLENIDDPAASGGSRIELAATDYDDYLEAKFDVPATGRYDLAVRFCQTPDSGIVAVAVDGRQLGGPVATATVAVRAFRTATFGRVQLHRGTHTMRFTVIDKQEDSGGIRIAPDHLTLVRS